MLHLRAHWVLWNGWTINIFPCKIFQYSVSWWLCVAVWHNWLSIHVWFCTSDSYSEDRRTVGSDSIPGLTVVLTALSRANLWNGEDRTGFGAPCCTEEGRPSNFLRECYKANSHLEPHRAWHLTDWLQTQQIIELGLDDFVMLPLSWTTFLQC